MISSQRHFNNVDLICKLFNNLFNRWANQNETPGQEFANERVRKTAEEKKFISDTKDTSKNESPNDNK